MTLKMLFVLVLLIATTPSAVADKTSAPPESATRTIVLVRHGNYLPNPDADKKLGPGLSVLGVAQAQMAGARLVGFPGGFDALYVSPMQRARDTAAAIAQEFPGRSFSIIDGLEECTPPTWRKEVADKEDPASMAACKKQLDGVFEEYFTPAQGKPRTEMMVCHGNVIRYLVTRALGVIPSRGWRCHRATPASPASGWKRTVASRCFRWVTLAIFRRTCAPDPRAMPIAIWAHLRCRCSPLLRLFRLDKRTPLAQVCQQVA